METLPERVSRLAMVARWRPVHLGHSRVLRALARYSDHVLVGIGSSNRHDPRNPFTVQETREMLGLALEGYRNYEVLEVPDLGDPPRWRDELAHRLGPLDLFVTANRWVRDLMIKHYEVVHPVHLVPPEERVPIDATMVRKAMVEGGDWTSLVEPLVAAYLQERGLVERFIREFGGRYA